MIVFISLLAFSLLGLLAMNLRRVYGQIPLRELKRRSNRGDQTAQCLYLVAHHGITADRFLLAAAAVSGSLAVVIASRSLDFFWAVAVVIGLLVLFSLPLEIKSFRPVHIIAQRLAPYLGQLFVRLRPLLQKASRLVGKYRQSVVRTKLYEKEDLIELLRTQKTAANNRIGEAELDIAMHALGFGEKKVKDHMTPRRAIRFVSRDEPIGPVLMSELHGTGFSRFPVTGKDDNEVVGTLYFRSLLERTKPGIVSNIMSSAVYYVSESAPLEQVLDGFIKTKHHLFIVVNEFEEIVGLITIEDVIEQILGRKIVDEFDRYDDLRAVAGQNARHDNAKHKHI